ncbi:hypothetical protein A7K91_02750 [Paenibacillus oryzae]|uniref:Amino acid decarboxylase n=1 Tax=Paenibacillus oryzae TaxID=1844972 RepID=A0A1A5YAZ4_9BACL|nr:aminotransferase class I/II-fold pyridoxal phosphate-dependent enzyme [Paenibacillus oryzae]OBR62545.1 hypothetical protein A7K91_02750 [Paenibacillus oryzae]
MENKIKIQAPLYEALVRHRSGQPSSFHVPGHHGGRSFQYGVEEWLSSVEGLKETFLPLMEMDLTELASTDDLHHPEACIAESQQLAAATFGSEETFFLVGGSTAGNIGVLLAVCEPGDVVIVQRNVHKSVIHGLKLAGAKAVFLAPEYDGTGSLATVPSAELVSAAIGQYPDAKAVFLSNPNYYGLGADLAAYAAICHSQGIPLLVDEAHGAHYGLHPELPSSAISAGADAVVQSAHKTLPALTMGAMLHVQGNRLNRGKIKNYLSMIQSSSPSFPIMATLDISRAMIDAAGPALFQSALDGARAFNRWLREQEGIIQAYEPAVSDLQYDPLRVLLYDRSGRLSGFELQRQLEQRQCWAEMSNSTYTLLIFGIGANEENLRCLKEAITDIHSRYMPDKKIGALNSDSALMEGHTTGAGLGISNPVQFSRQMIDAEGPHATRIALKEAAGCIAAEMVVPYPPGIPLLYQGEAISEAVIGEIMKLAAAGAKFQGSVDDTMRTISILIEEKK